MVEPNVTPAISWTQLGLPERMDLIGSNQKFDTSIPVPEGIGPALLTGEIGSVVNVVDGRVDVLDSRGIVLGSIGVPVGVSTAPFLVDITAAQVTEGRAPLSFILRENNPPSNSCSVPPSLSLSQLMTTYSGPPPDPTTVAGFLPGYLDQILINVGPHPSGSQQQAALNLVSALTRVYRPMPVRIAVTTTEFPPLAGGPLTRVIDMRDGEQAGIAVENPGTPNAVLAITGTGDELMQQVDLLTDRRIGLAQSDSAVVLSARTDVAQSTNIKTFGQLGMTGSTSVLGTSTLYAGFDVSEFGVGSISSATIHLKAKYTPISGGEGSILIRSGSTVVATHTLDNSGVLDLTGEIPPESITSNVGMAMELRYIPRQECAPLNDRMTFTLDPASTVAVTPGTHNRGGFPILPMAFTPEFDVAIDSPEHLPHAAQAINLMGQHTAVMLRPRLTAFSAAASSSTPLLAVTSSDELAKANMKAPLLPGGPNTVEVTGSTSTDVDLKGALGIVQAFTDKERTILAVSGSGDWSLVDASFEYIRALPNRWASLTGDVVATGAAHETVNLTVREGGGLVNEYPGDPWKWWAWATIGLGGCAVLAAAIWMIVRRRTRT
ncbi:hypothetical protein H7J93_24625 [Mycobacterium barrassiae]|uniref:hypothetical protein n=1 Tax=Mycobacterium barrassiae TaxID=319709 RepID=UPI0022659716|nr:hypothetical protein [Mycobacterium barrassiae]MCV7302815.1 hypothetical protein [Mycobacterium barrassiae]